MIILRKKNFSLAGTRMLAGTHRLLGRSKIQAARRALETENKIINNLAKSKNTIERVALNPGQATDQLLAAGIRNPITVGSQVAGKALMVAPVPLSVKAAPIGAGGTMLEVALKKVSPTYKNATNKFADEYLKQTKFRKGLTNGVNTGVEYFKTIAGA